MFLTSALISPFAGSIVDRFGRFKTLIMVNLLIIISSILTLFKNIYIILIGRCILGIPTSLLVVVCPLFLR